jgi:uncharacterized membrane protein
MEKTKLGISVALTAVVVTLLGYYGGYVIGGIAIGYVLLQEQNEWLKKHALRVLALMLSFSVASTLLWLIPDVLNLFYSFMELFNVHIYINVVNSCFNFLGNVLSLLKTVVFVLLAYSAFTQKEFKVPVVDKLIEKVLSK